MMNRRVSAVPEQLMKALNGTLARTIKAGLI
jgi:hypothetical protein